MPFLCFQLTNFQHYSFSAFSLLYGLQINAVVVFVAVVVVVVVVLRTHAKLAKAHVVSASQSVKYLFPLCP